MNSIICTSFHNSFNWAGIEARQPTSFYDSGVAAGFNRRRIVDF